MAKKLIIDPVSRIEGHLKVEVKIDGGKVVDAHTSGMLFRGYERILMDRDPRDAVPITQRACGVCPTSHGITSAQCLDNAFKVTPTDNGRILRNLIQGSNFIQSHILHFYHLTALDYVKGPDASPFIPRFEGDYRLSKKVNDKAVADYVKALEMRMKAHEMSAIFSGKMPHQATVVVGGVGVIPTKEAIALFSKYLKELRGFIDNVYLPDVIAVAEAYKDYFTIGAGCKNLLSYGVFDLDSNPDVSKRKRLLVMGCYTDGKVNALSSKKITEDVKSSWYKSPSGLHPSQGKTQPDYKKEGAYSWIKSPRYDGKVHEVGPLARMGVTHLSNANQKVSKLITDTLNHFKADVTALFSVLGRHAARALECKVIADEMENWLKEIKIGQPVCKETKVPKKAKGMGLWEAPRGALGHWIEVKNSKIQRYQLVVPTTWNMSPRDEKGSPGPVEQALIGAPVPDEKNPFSILRIIRSFDPCIACSVHTINVEGKSLSEFKVC